MTKRFQKNSKHIVDLINSATLTSISLLAQIDEFAFLDSVVDTSRPEHLARSELLEYIASVECEDIVVADREAVRLLQMMQFRSEELLERAYRIIKSERHKEIDTFDPAADAMTRLIWLRVKSPRNFDLIEKECLRLHFHGGKRYFAFTVQNGESREFEWTPEIADRLQVGIGEILGLSEDNLESCEISYFEMEGGDAVTKQRLHYLVISHPGKRKLDRQIKDRQRNLVQVTREAESTLVYNAAENKVHVHSNNQSAANFIANYFVVNDFEDALSNEPLSAVNYELEMFKQVVDFNNAKAGGAVILDSWVTSTLMTHSRTHFGDYNPLPGGSSVLKVELSFNIRFDDEEDTRALDITVYRDGACSLYALTDPRMRRCGEEVFSSLGVMKQVQPANVRADLAPFHVVMKLLELAVDEVNGHLLKAHNLPIDDLISKGLLRKEVSDDYITVPVEDNDGQSGFQCLEVKTSYNRTWAQDDLTGEIYDLSKEELYRYSVNKCLLRKWLKEQISAQLINLPMTTDEQDPYVLGNYCVADQRLRVVLVSRLGDTKHANKMGRALLRLNQGFIVVLTTTSGWSGQILGPGLVLSLEDLARVVDGQASIDLSRADGEIRRYLRPAVVNSAAKDIRFIKHGICSGVLEVPGLPAWILTKETVIAVVETLFNGLKSGLPYMSLDQIRQETGLKIPSMNKHFRGEPRWKNFIYKF